MSPQPATLSGINDTLRTAIIGCGRIAGLHADSMPAARITTHRQALQHNPRFEISALFDTDPARSAEMAAQIGTDVAHPMSDLAGLACDIAVIAAPDAAHAGLIERLLDLPRPPRCIVSEKPLCVTEADLTRLYGRLSTSSTMVIVNHSRRLDSRHRAAARLITSGELGEPISAHWVYYGGWMHNGTHAIDTLRMLLDDELEIDQARQGFPGHPGDPCLNVTMHCAAAPHVDVTMESFPETAFQIFEGEVRLSNGRIRFLDFGDTILIDRVCTNAIGERELRATTPLTVDDPRTTMQILYDEVAAFLTTGHSAILDSASAATAGGTMTTLFAARHAANRSTARTPDIATTQG